MYRSCTPLIKKGLVGIPVVSVMLLAKVVYLKSGSLKDCPLFSPTDFRAPVFPFLVMLEMPRALSFPFLE